MVTLTSEVGVVNINKRKGIGSSCSWLRLGLALAVFAGIGSANTLCTSFASPVVSGGTVNLPGFVCDVGDLQLFDLTYVWSFSPGVANPGTITIMVDSSDPGLPKLIVTAQNNWLVQGGGDPGADFSLFYTLNTTPGGHKIVGGDISLDTTLGWDHNTPTQDGSGAVAASDNFTPGSMTSQLTLLPPSQDGTVPCTPVPSSSTTPCHVTGTGNVSTFGTLQNSMHTEKDVDLLGGDHTFDIAQVNSVTQLIYEAVPEPLSFVLVGAGLLAGGLMRKHRGWKKQGN